MANTTEMIRIMRHAAEHLDQEHQRLLSGGFDVNKVADAMAYGSSILAMAAQTVEATDETR